MNRALLLKAMSDINDEYIEAAIDAPATPGKKRVTFRPRYVAAACAAAMLFSVIFVPIIIFGVNNIGQLNLPSTTKPGDDGQNPNAYYGLYGTAKNKFGSITFAEYADNKITLDLSIVDEASWENRSVAIYGYSYLPNVDASGVDGADATIYYTTNDGSSSEVDNGVYLPDALSVEVDGVASPDGSLPQKAGTYRIVIDFSAMFYVEGMLKMEQFTVGDICFKLYEL